MRNEIVPNGSQNLYSHTLQQPLQQQPITTTKPQDPATQQANEFSRRLKETYEHYLRQQNALAATTLGSNPSVNQVAPSTLLNHPTTILNSAKRNEMAPNLIPVSAAKRPSEFTDQGSMTLNSSENHSSGNNAMVGFLKSLKQSYEEAVRGKQDVTTSADGGCSEPLQTASGISNNSSGAIDSSKLMDLAACIAFVSHNNSHNFGSERRTATVTDSASSTQNQAESSAEDCSDWNSDKKTDPSSSEESDKEMRVRKSYDQHTHYSTTGKGPPRKRMKPSTT